MAPTTVNSSVRTREYLTTAEIERLMAAARKSSRYGHRDATMILLCYRHDASSSSARRRLVQPTLYYAQASAVLDHSITLPQGDRNARPTLARGEIGSERNLIVLDAGDVLNDGFAVRSPGINAEGEVSSRCGHGIRDARRGG